MTDKEKLKQLRTEVRELKRVVPSRRGRPVKNRFNVPKKQWDRWSRHARRVFNDVYYSMRPTMQWAFHHPEAQLLDRKHWQTTRWNAAWVAAEATDGKPPLVKVVEV